VIVEPASTAPATASVRLFRPGAPVRTFAELRRTFAQDRFEELQAGGFRFYQTTFWYPLDRPPENIFERVVASLRPLAAPSPGVTGVEWWFSVLETNATPQWLLPCHFDRDDLDEQDPRKVEHPDRASVLFLNAVPYGELVITDQVLTAKGTRPRQPADMLFVTPERNLYAVFPGHLYHGVIGRMWRPQRKSMLRVSMAVNYWAKRPKAAYLRDSRDGMVVFGLGGAKRPPRP
jgi:hypothetical protein